MSQGYHIIFVPKDPQKTKRIHLSKFTVRILSFLAVLIVPVILATFFTSVYFQDQASDLRRAMIQETQLVEQKEILASRLTDLERSIMRTERSLAQLEKALDVEVGQVKSGLGPIEDKELAEELKNIPKTHLKIGSLLGSEQILSVQKINNYTHLLGKRVNDVQSQIDHILEINLDKIRYLNSTPNIMPVAGWITSGFGMRRSPINGRYKMHYGIDVAASTGTKIFSAASGTVVFARSSKGYGRKVVVDHGFGVKTIYAHCSKLFVKEGQQVARGETIASVGNTGASTGPHLHYEVHVDGVPADPLKYVWQD